MNTLNRRYWQLVLALGLLVLSAALYILHFVLFRDAHHIFIYLVGDVAFVPIEVLLVTLIIHRLLEVREKRSLMRKLNMVIGAFFSEAGAELLKRLLGFCAEPEAVSDNVVLSSDWGAGQFEAARKAVKARAPSPDASRGDLAPLRTLLAEHRSFLLGLLRNPNLLEHEAFTDLLWAVTHLAEELSHRRTLEDLPASDLEHLSGDMRRAFGLLIVQWLSYMEHLSVEYPYLYSLAVRTNPFNPNARAEVGEA